MLGLELIIMEMNVCSQGGKLQKQKELESSEARGTQKQSQPILENDSVSTVGKYGVWLNTTDEESRVTEWIITVWDLIPS